MFLLDLWSSVVARVQALRAREGLEPLFSNYMSAYQQFGLDNSLVTRLVEQLPKAENCTKYRFKYFTPPKMGQWEHLKRVCHSLHLCSSVCAVAMVLCCLRNT